MQTTSFLTCNDQFMNKNNITTCMYILEHIRTYNHVDDMLYVIFSQPFPLIMQSQQSPNSYLWTHLQ